ncbi:MAG: hypothetical protein ABR606_19465 [Vicinamibacterales bacterium]
MLARFARARVGTVAFVLVLASPAVSLAQNGNASFRVSPFEGNSPAPLLKVDLAEPPARRGAWLGLSTLTSTETGLRLTNAGLRPPSETIGDLAMAPRIGEQQVPLTFLSSTLSGQSLNGTMRGVSFSTVDSTPWSLALGKLDAGSAASAHSSDAPGILAVAGSLKPHQRLSLTPRVIVPVGSRQVAPAGVGTEIRAGLSPHVSFLADVGASDTARVGWTPLAAAGVVGQWARTEVATNVLRGGPSPTSPDPALIGSLDRELARGQVRPIPGLTISGLASRSRPTGPTRTSNTTNGSVGVVYDRLPRGQVVATTERELDSSRHLNITRLEWRHPAPRGLTARYTQKRQMHDAAPNTSDLSRQLELEIPAWPGHDAGSRVDLRAVLTADPSSTGRALSSRLTGRLDVFGEIGLAGETEVGLTGASRQQALRTVRLTSDVALPHETALQVLYTYRSGMPFALKPSFEARVFRTIPLFTW